MSFGKLKKTAIQKFTKNGCHYINHVESVSKIEVDSVKDMFGRSVSEYDVKYSQHIGNGDSATYKGLLD